MEAMTLEAGAAALEAMVKGLGRRLDVLNDQSGWTNAMMASAGGAPDWMNTSGGAKQALMNADRASGTPWGAGRAQEMSDPLPARERSEEMDAESMGRLVADTVNREIGRLARARRYTG